MFGNKIIRSLPTFLKQSDLRNKVEKNTTFILSNISRCGTQKQQTNKHTSNIQGSQHKESEFVCVFIQASTDAEPISKKTKTHNVRSGLRTQGKGMC